jgi:hypothetical protein
LAVSLPFSTGLDVVPDLIETNFLHLALDIADLDKDKLPFGKRKRNMSRTWKRRSQASKRHRIKPLLRMSF